MVTTRKLKKKTIYMTKNKIRGVDGLYRYHVDKKSDIKYLGSLNSKYSSLTIPEFKRFMREYHDTDVTIKLV